MFESSFLSHFWRECERARARMAAPAVDAAPGDLSGEERLQLRISRLDPRDGLTQERIANRSNAWNEAFVSRLQEAARAIGLVRIYSPSGRETATGSGVLLPGAVVLVPASVIPSKKDAYFGQFWVDFASDADGDAIGHSTFSMNPDGFFYRDPELDFALVAINEVSDEGEDLEEISALVLAEDEPTLAEGERVHIIQHVQGSYRQYVLSQDHAAHPSSDHFLVPFHRELLGVGAAIFNEEWELVGICHAGVPTEESETLNDAVWTGNEVLRSEAIVRVLRGADWNLQHEKKISEILMEPETGMIDFDDLEDMDDEFDFEDEFDGFGLDGFDDAPVRVPLSLVEGDVEAIPDVEVLDAEEPLTATLHPDLQLSEDEYESTERVTEEDFADEGIAALEEESEEEVADEEIAAREEVSEESLEPETTEEEHEGAETELEPEEEDHAEEEHDGLEVEMVPELASSLASKPLIEVEPTFDLDANLADGITSEYDHRTASLSERAYQRLAGFDHNFIGPIVHLPRMLPSLKQQVARTPQGVEVLDYTHYSVVMNARRKLAFFTAVNVDRSQASRVNRQLDLLLYDSRISREAQVGPEVYAGNVVERGQLVNRDLTVWGESADRAMIDAHHFTNHAPHQIHLSTEIWQSVEAYVIQSNQNVSGKASVFSGPVLKVTDPIFRGVQIPQAFWKVVAFSDESGKLRACGFMQTQKKVESTEEGEIDAGYVTYQVSIADVEAETGLDFGDLRDSDSLVRGEKIEITSYDRIRI